MSDTRFIGDENLQSVENLMDPAVRIEPDAQVGDALRRLQQQNVTYGVVSDTWDQTFKIVTMDQLIGIDFSTSVMQVSLETLPHSVTIEPYEALSKAVEIWEKAVESSQMLIDIVVQEHGMILGVLPGQKIIDYIQGNQSRTFGWGYSAGVVGRLGGNMHVDNTPGKLVFICSDCPQGQKCFNDPNLRERVIDQDDYDPDDPPKCEGEQHLKMTKMI